MDNSQPDMATPICLDRTIVGPPSMQITQSPMYLWELDGKPGWPKIARHWWTECVWRPDLMFERPREPLQTREQTRIANVHLMQETQHFSAGIRLRREFITYDRFRSRWTRPLRGVTDEDA